MKKAKRLMSFRLASETADFLVDQSDMLGITTTELVNRLLLWAIQNVPEGFFQRASLSSGRLSTDNQSERKKEPPNVSQTILASNIDANERQNNPDIQDTDLKKMERRIFEKADHLFAQLKEKLEDEVKLQFSNLNSEDSKNSEEEKTLVENRTK